MKDLIIKADEQFALFNKGDTVTVALSGGADSVALLHSLVRLSEHFGITVNAAHLNHSIRGQEADRDQQFAESLCSSLNVKLFCEKIDVPQFAKENHLSLELAARTVRYEFLQRVAVGKIATAHTASDNLETLIFNLTRGTALKGLCGIPPKRDNIIRPIILCTRNDVEAYCKENSLDYVTDSTNLSDEYSRNKIRHNIIPVLKEINPAVESAAVRTALSVREDTAFLETKAREIMFSLCDDDRLLVGGFKDMPKALAKRVIIQYFEICFSDICLENRHINEVLQICLNESGKVNLPSDLYAVVKNGGLYFQAVADFNTGFKVNITKTENVNNLFANDLIDCDKIVGKLVVRTREEGDSIRLFNRGCTKTLKKLFTEYKVPLNIRNTLPVIADDSGVVWVHTIGVSQRCAVNKNTKKAYKIEVL